MSQVSLSTILIPSRVATIDFPGFEGLQIDMCHMAREELIKLRKRCSTTKFNRFTHQPEETLDDEKFVRAYCSKVIQGWKGLKYKYLEELLLVDISELDPEDELIFTEDNAILLMQNSSRFEAWVTESVNDLANFTKNK